MSAALPTPLDEWMWRNRLRNKDFAAHTRNRGDALTETLISVLRSGKRHPSEGMKARLERLTDGPQWIGKVRVEYWAPQPAPTEKE